MATAKTNTPMHMRYRWQDVKKCIADLEAKDERIMHALRQLYPLVGQKGYMGPERRGLDS
jgi:hypothetical protein